MLIEDFFKEDYITFANRRAEQRIPNWDGLNETQRKVLYTSLENNYTTKTKTISIMADTMKKTHYQHGDASLNNVISNMAADYNNQIPLLTNDGSFGYRANNRAAEARYTSTKLKPYIRLLFNPLDNKHFTDINYDENGEVVEPKSLIPLLPLLFINGQQQMGVGFATNILSRDPFKIIKILKDLLSSKRKSIPSTIGPDFKYFKGTIQQNDVTEYNSWDIFGKFEKKPRNTIIINEVPISYDRIKVISIFDKLQESGKIKSFKENISKNSFYIEVKCTPETYALPDEKIIKLFGLKESISEYITIIKYDLLDVDIENFGQYMKHFIQYRLNIYNKRKEFLLKEIKDKIIKLEEIIKFIHLVNDESIIINKQTEIQLVHQIQKFQLMKIDDSYSYLLNLKIYDLTLEKVQQHENKIHELKEEFSRIKNTTIYKMWLDDIIEFEKALKKDRKD